MKKIFRRGLFQQWWDLQGRADSVWTGLTAEGVPRKEQKTAASRSGRQRKEPLVGSGSRGMRKAEGLAPTSWRVAQRLMNILNRTLNLILISRVLEWAPVVEKHVKLVDWASSMHVKPGYFLFIPPSSVPQVVQHGHCHYLPAPTRAPFSHHSFN